MGAFPYSYASHPTVPDDTFPLDVHIQIRPTHQIKKERVL